MSKEASESFWRAFSNSGTIVATCACGKTYFCAYSNEGNFDEGELERYQINRAKDPENWIELDCSHVSTMQLGGKTYVEGCKCGGVYNYENFIWTWRAEILEYIAARHTADQATLNILKKSLDKAQAATAITTSSPALLPDT